MTARAAFANSKKVKSTKFKNSCLEFSIFVSSSQYPKAWRCPYSFPVSFSLFPSPLCPFCSSYCVSLTMSLLVYFPPSFLSFLICFSSLSLPPPSLSSPFSFYVSPPISLPSVSSTLSLPLGLYPFFSLPMSLKIKLVNTSYETMNDRWYLYLTNILQKSLACPLPSGFGFWRQASHVVRQKLGNSRFFPSRTAILFFSSCSQALFLASRSRQHKRKNIPQIITPCRMGGVFRYLIETMALWSEI